MAKGAAYPAVGSVESAPGTRDSSLWTVAGYCCNGYCSGLSVCSNSASGDKIAAAGPLESAAIGGC